MESAPENRDVHTSSQIQIDVTSLWQFSVFIQHELVAAIAPMAARVTRGLVEGGDLGPHLPSDDLDRMNVAHFTCVTAMSRQLDAFASSLAFFADAAGMIASRYTASDALAHATIADITPLINAASQGQTGNDLE
jgi:hypothetical protein